MLHAASIDLQLSPPKKARSAAVIAANTRGRADRTHAAAVLKESDEFASTSKSLCTLCTALGDMGRSQRNSRPPKMVTEATFDVDARKDWLQGFRKRKRERRLTGLAHGALKARKQKLADRAARRSMRPPPAPEPVVLDEAPATRETVVLTDSNVVEQWGAAVTEDI